MMGTKNNPGTFDCYRAALPDEPMFILLGRDPTAPNIVRDWASRRLAMIDRGESPASDKRKAEEADACADEMERWRKDNLGAWRTSFPNNHRIGEYIECDCSVADCCPQGKITNAPKCRIWKKRA